MKRISLTEMAHQRVEEQIAADANVIDATVGNGHDTLILAQAVGLKGRVFGFDIQQQALLNTRQRLQEHNLEKQVTLIQASHADMQHFIPQNLHECIAAIMFNLGYLPGADKHLTTQRVSTLCALEAGCSLLKAHGIMTVTVYPGHIGGDDEAQAVTRWFQKLPQDKFARETLECQYPTPKSPRLFVIRKLH